MIAIAKPKTVTIPLCDGMGIPYLCANCRHNRDNQSKGAISHQPDIVPVIRERHCKYFFQTSNRPSQA